MQLTTVLATTLVLALAEAKIAFTQAPGSSITAGNPFTLKWDGAMDNDPVTITLKQGDPDNLTTVSLITGDATGGSYVWTPSTSLVDADNYALEIGQGTGYDDTNYSGEFAITGGAASSSSSVTVTMTSGNSTFVTSHPAYPATTGSVSMHSNNITLHHTSKAPSVTTGGIVVTSVKSVPAATTAQATSASSSGVAAQYGPLGGAAAALMGLAALL